MIRDGMHFGKGTRLVAFLLAFLLSFPQFLVTASAEELSFEQATGIELTEIENNPQKEGYDPSVLPVENFGDVHVERGVKEDLSLEELPVEFDGSVSFEVNKDISFEEETEEYKPEEKEEVYTGISEDKSLRTNSVDYRGVSDIIYSPITLPYSVSGYFDGTEGLSNRGTYGKGYQFYATAGQIIYIRMNSPYIDSYLYLLNSSYAVLAYDDDSNGGVNSRITYTIGSSGYYYIQATMFTNYTGSFSLSVESIGDSIVEYNANGGTGAPQAQTKPYNTAITLSGMIPVRAGYSFIGWSASSSTDTADYAPLDTYSTNSSITLYAVWKAYTLIPMQNYSLSSYIDSSDGYSIRGTRFEGFTVSLSAGQTITIDMVSQNFDAFLYLLDSEGIIVSLDDDSGGAQNAKIEYTAPYAGTFHIQATQYSTALGSFTLNVNVQSETHRITYNANGGHGAPVEQIKENGVPLALSNIRPSRLGYIFMGWATFSLSETVSYRPGDVINEDKNLELYAVWGSYRRILESPYYDSSSLSLTDGYSYGGGKAKGYSFDVSGYEKKVAILLKSSDFDGYLYLLNDSGLMIASDDDSGGNYNAKIEYTISTPGTYYIQATHYGSYYAGYTGNFTIEVVLQDASYTVSYNANGGTGEPSDQIKLNNVSLALSGQYPTRDNYIFMGWSSNPSATLAEYQPLGVYSANAPITLYAVWKDYDSISIPYNAASSIASTDGYSKRGTQLKGYSFTANAGQKVIISMSSSSFDSYLYLLNSSGAIVAQDDDGGGGLNSKIEYTVSTGGTHYIQATQYGRATGNFTLSVTSGNYTVTYNANGGEGAPGNQTKISGQPLTLSNLVPYREGYAFVGWSANQSASIATYQPLGIYSADANVTLYAVWQLYAPISLPYNSSSSISAVDGYSKRGTRMKGYSFSATAGETVTINMVSSAFDSYLYLLDGSWSIVAADDDSGGSLNAKITYKFTASGTYYIQATQYGLSTGSFNISVESESQYQVSYNANGGSGAPTNQTKLSNVPLTLSTTLPVRSGYVFLGWSTVSTAVSASYQPGGVYTNNVSVTLYAVWQPYTNVNMPHNDSYSMTTSDGILNWPRQTRYKGFSFTASSGQLVTITMNTTSFDSYLYLLNSSGGIVAQDDDSGGSRNAKISLTIPSSGVYYIQASQYSSGTGAFTLSVTGGVSNYMVSYDGNGGTGAPANQMKPDGANTNLSNVIPNRVGYVFLGWSPNQTAVSADYRPGDIYSTNASITLYAVWRAYSDISLPYSISSSIALTDGYSKKGTPMKGYKFTANAGQKATILMTSTNFDSYLYLLDSNGGIISYDDDNGGSYNARIEYTFSTAGTYYIQATQYRNAAGNFNLSASFATTPLNRIEVSGSSSWSGTTGGSRDITIRAVYTNGTSTDITQDSALAAGSSNRDVADIALSGGYYRIMAKAAGSAEITFTYQGKSFVYPVTVISTVRPPTVITGDATKQGETATLFGSVTSNGGETLTAYGFEWGSSVSDLDETITIGGGTVASFSRQLLNLTAGTTYYYRAFATNSAGTAVGETRTVQISQTQRKYRALVIGNNNYIYANPLNGCISDATYIKQMLEANYFEDGGRFEHITLLTDGTKSSTMNAIRNTFAYATNDDVSYIFYSGHGARTNGVSYLVPVDGSTTSTCISVDELEAALSVIPGKVMVFLDSCHSGGFVNKGLGLEEFEQFDEDELLLQMDAFNEDVLSIFGSSERGYLTSDKYRVITASSASQYSYESTLNIFGTRIRMGFFTAALVNGCGHPRGTFAADTNRDNKITLTEAVTYTRNVVRGYTPNQSVQASPETSNDILFQYIGGRGGLEFGDFIDDYGNDPTIAHAVSLNEQINGMIDYEGDIDCFKLEISDGGNYVFNVSSATYMKLRLTDSSNESVGEDFSGNMRIIIGGLEPGEYYLHIESLFGEIGAYSFTVDSPRSLITATGIQIDRTTAQVLEFNHINLTATPLPLEATDRSVSWESNDPSIASVNEVGVVTGVSAGVAVITAKIESGASATCTVTVIKNEELQAGFDAADEIEQDDSISGVFGSNLDELYYKFTIDEETAIVITTDSSFLIYKTLYDEYRKELPTTDRSVLSDTLSPGTYYIKLVTDNRSGGEFELFIDRAESGVTVSGTVKLADGDVGSATVTLTNGTNVINGRTEENGSYLITNVAPGTYSMTIHKDSYLSYSNPSLEIGSADVEYEEIALTPGDVNGDGYINATDLALILNNFNKTADSSSMPSADINGDGYVNADDLAFVLNNFNKEATVES